MTKKPKAILDQTKLTWDLAKEENNMTKQDLQKELKDKVKEGIKPSHLKRSKSLNDIPKIPPLPNQKLEQENKELKAQLQKVNADWTNLAQQRVENLKETPNPRIAELQTELAETVKDATQEINKQEQIIKGLQSKLTQTNNKNTDLAEQIKLYQRAAELRINEPNKEPNYSDFWEQYGLIVLLLGTYCLSAWMLNHNHQINKNHE